MDCVYTYTGFVETPAGVPHDPSSLRFMGISVSTDVSHYFKDRIVKTGTSSMHELKVGIPVVICAGVGVLYHVDHLLRLCSCLFVSFLISTDTYAICLTLTPFPGCNFRWHSLLVPSGEPTLPLSERFRR